MLHSRIGRAAASLGVGVGCPFPVPQAGRHIHTFRQLSIWPAAGLVQPRATIATHYHEPRAPEGRVAGAANVRATVSEQGGRLAFACRIRPVAASRSYGLEVARMAGIPPELLDRAGRCWRWWNRYRARRRGGS